MKKIGYLSTQVKITQQDGSFRASDDEDDEHEKEESKHVICLM